MHALGDARRNPQLSHVTTAGTAVATLRCRGDVQNARLVLEEPPSRVRADVPASRYFPRGVVNVLVNRGRDTVIWLRGGLVSHQTFSGDLCRSGPGAGITTTGDDAIKYSFIY